MKSLKIWQITESCDNLAIYHLFHGDKYSDLLHDVQDIVCAWEDIDSFDYDTKEYIEQLLERSSATKEFLENINICDEFDLDVTKIYIGEEGAKEYLELFIKELRERKGLADINVAEGSEHKNLIDAILKALKNGCKDRGLVMVALDEISNYFYDISSFHRVII